MVRVKTRERFGRRRRPAGEKIALRRSESPIALAIRTGEVRPAGEKIALRRSESISLLKPVLLVPSSSHYKSINTQRSPQGSFQQRTGWHINA
jgi:hypothetical protein